MSYEKDIKEFKRKYGEKAIPNSIRVTGFFLEKVRKQDKWILHFNPIGRINWFNKGVKDLCTVEIADSYLPNIALVVGRKELKEIVDASMKKLKGRRK